MPIPSVYKRLATKLQPRKMLLWKLFAAGAGFCMVAIIWAYSPAKIGGMDPFLRLALIVTIAAAGAELALVSFGLVCVRYWFGSSPADPDARKSKALWPGLGDLAFGVSDWNASLALACLLVASVGLAFGLVVYGLVPIVAIII